MAVAYDETTGSTDQEKTERQFRQWVDDALEDRRRFEPTWHEAIEFARGKQWLFWNRFERRMMMPEELQAIAGDLYTADRVTEYRMTALGEMAADDDRPELLLVKDDEWDEGFQRAINKAVGHGWDHEWDGDGALMEARRYVIDMGTSAIRPRFDPSVGPVKDDLVPYLDGKPILDTEQAIQLFDEGAPLDFRKMREGRHNWEPLSAFNIMVPPGVPHERDFACEGIVRPVPLDTLREQFPAAADLKEDVDIASLIGLSASDENMTGRGSDADGDRGRKQRLRGHVWLYTVYERPCPKYQEGRVVVLAGAKRKLLKVEPRLPYVRPNGEYTSGIGYFHWWRVTGRFWSRGLVDSMIDGQRRFNKRATQNGKIIDRGMPKVFLREDSVRNWPTGLPMEVVELSPGAEKPEFQTGVGPGEWMWKDLEQVESDLSHATGIYGPARGENPQNVDTYSQLALIAENDQTKRQPIYKEHRQTIIRLVEAAVHDIRVYWGQEKKILVTSDDEDMVSAMTFDSTKIPDFFIVRGAKGPGKPKSQGAMLQLVNDLKVAALEAQLFAGPEWLEWYRNSLEAGQPLDFPEVPSSQAADLAEIENHKLLEGEDVPVTYYDPIQVHVPLHRLAQDQARQVGDSDAYNRIEEHIMRHEQAATEMQQMLAQAGGGTLPNDPDAPPQQIPEPEIEKPVNG